MLKPPRRYNTGIRNGANCRLAISKYPEVMWIGHTERGRQEKTENLLLPLGVLFHKWSNFANKASQQWKERIRLSKDAKLVLHLLNKGQYTCPKATPFAIFNDGAHELESNHLAICFEEEGGNVEIVCLTNYGKLYLENNPRLCNPVDWKWIITTTITAIAAIASSIALFVACKVLNQ